MTKLPVLPIILLIFFGISTTDLTAQRRQKNKLSTENVVKPFVSPKLVVGIVVDQMRYDYLTRFWAHYGEGGFKRLALEGFNCKNNHFNYAPTKTGPGHASIYTGTTPATHGIIANDWYDKLEGKEVYCAGDSSYRSVGSNSAAGQMSPHRMNVSTITDQLRLHTQMRGKTIAISLKDRGAVLPGGHTANAAYWFEGEDYGQWVSSSFYMQVLPKWVIDFNNSDKIRAYKKAWTPLKEISNYLESGLDDHSSEGVFESELKPVFPHSTPNLLAKDRDFEIIKYTPYGNSLTTDFALEALKKESLGKDSFTDFLAVSYSSTDYIGHKYGVNSKEVQDTYLRLDQDLARLLNSLDQEVGAGQYTVFLTADHGAMHTVSFLKEHKIPSNYFTLVSIQTEFDNFLKYHFGTTDIVKNISNDQIFLDHKIIQNLDLSLKEVQETVAREFLGYEGVDRVFTADQMLKSEYAHGLAHLLQNGYHQKRSGDVLIVLKPGTIHWREAGSTHGSPWSYDTHVPLIFYGKGIKRGATFTPTEITDIAPTMAALLGIAYPNGTTGKPIVEVLE